MNSPDKAVTAVFELLVLCFSCFLEIILKWNTAYAAVLILVFSFKFIAFSFLLSVLVYVLKFLFASLMFCYWKFSAQIVLSICIYIYKVKSAVTC